MSTEIDKTSYQNSESSKLEIISGPHDTSITKPAGSNYKQLNLPHGLTFKPVLLAFMGSGGTGIQLPFLSIRDDNGTINEYLSSGADETNVYFFFTCPSDNGIDDVDVTYPLTYFILRQAISPSS